ncbi:MAG: hypothetical protein KGO02_12560 [Alphaproteobacteria bacterium]|nr:hypothetical protein [Alphaproteobacteria bacterium]
MVKPWYHRLMVATIPDQLYGVLIHDTESHADILESWVVLQRWPRKVPRKYHVDLVGETGVPPRLLHGLLPIGQLSLERDHVVGDGERKKVGSAG